MSVNRVPSNVGNNTNLTKTKTEQPKKNNNTTGIFDSVKELYDDWKKGIFNSKLDVYNRSPGDSNFYGNGVFY